MEKNPGRLSRWRRSKYFLFSIAILVSLLTAAVGVTVTLLEQSFPTGPAAAIPIVHINSACNSTSTPLNQLAIGSGVFTNASGTFITSGSSVSILYTCGTNPNGSPAAALSVVQETPPKLAPATPTITGQTTGALYVINYSGANPNCASASASGTFAYGYVALLSSGTAVSLASGDYAYCLVINSYTSQLQAFTVTWTS